MGETQGPNTAVSRGLYSVGAEVVGQPHRSRKPAADAGSGSPARSTKSTSKTDLAL